MKFTIGTIIALAAALASAQVKVEGDQARSSAPMASPSHSAHHHHPGHDMEGPDGHPHHPFRPPHIRKEDIYCPSEGGTAIINPPACRASQSSHPHGRPSPMPQHSGMANMHHHHHQHEHDSEDEEAEHQHHQHGQHVKVVYASNAVIVTSSKHFGLHCQGVDGPSCDHVMFAPKTCSNEAKESGIPHRHREHEQHAQHKRAQESSSGSSADASGKETITESTRTVWVQGTPFCKPGNSARHSGLEAVMTGSPIVQGGIPRGPPAPAPLSLPPGGIPRGPPAASPAPIGVI